MESQTATGMRIRTTVSETPFSFSEIVRNSAGEPDGPAARSALAPRLIATVSSGVREPDDD